MRKFWILFVLTVVISAGCSDGNDKKAETATAWGAADTAFALGMIEHHRQALQMADLAERSASDPRVRALATRIKGAQQPEILRMEGWLASYEASPPSVPSGDSHAGHGESSGMLSVTEMQALESATGSAFDRRFLELMIKHHEGAIAMAETQKKSGGNAEAKALAEQIHRSQSDEITEMKSILAELK